MLDLVRIQVEKGVRIGSFSDLYDSVGHTTVFWQVNLP